jgi:hypothetical protein
VIEQRLNGLSERSIKSVVRRFEVAARFRFDTREGVGTKTTVERQRQVLIKRPTIQSAFRVSVFIGRLLERSMTNPPFLASLTSGVQ